MISLKIMRPLLLSFVCISSLAGKNILLEFNGSYFLPTNSTFKKIYHGGALFGPELTMQLFDDKQLYVFTGINYFQKKGKSIGLCYPTTVKLIPFVFGLKYLLPTFYNHVDFYAGLGFQAVSARIKNCTPTGPNNQFITSSSASEWGFGGILKMGAYFHLPRNFFIHTFIGYSFVRVGNNNCACLNANGSTPTKTNISGAIFGAVLGYRF